MARKRRAACIIGTVITREQADKQQHGTERHLSSQLEPRVTQVHISNQNNKQKEQALVNTLTMGELLTPS